MLNFHRECWNPAKKHSKALVFFAVSKQIPIVYSADRGRAEITHSCINIYAAQLFEDIVKSTKSHFQTTKTMFES